MQDAGCRMQDANNVNWDPLYLSQEESSGSLVSLFISHIL
jgi:hypothetical protein